ncbi:uncharacterized protein LOC122881832 isoform X2 [Siniperca chuatsi]|uniref:uncharacterized protein LOC122881832 isoform X2 n=1 Tax=Siniperca chuatsi TaxID=119488 RepID=UPI001CE1946C|nr:uncharacterized protein LOC122881832 isoform X2 [Siniperca chuatsi]XP_044064409.1 uncharacterized protein LOC122881832 isoform X2 [Siniperca chuatsi]
MMAYILQTVFTWTFKGILCTCRFLWICPYNAIKFLPREQHITEDTSRKRRQLVGSESKGIAAIPGSPDRTTALQKRLTKTEKEILSIKTRIACERASWERRFSELQRKQEELHNQLASQTGVLVKEDSCDDQRESGVDNGEVFEKCSSGFSRIMYQHKGSEVPSRCDTYASSLSGNQLSSSSALSSRPASSSSSATRCSPKRNISARKNTLHIHVRFMEDIPRTSPGFCTPLPHGPGTGSPGQDHAAVWTDQHRNYSFPGPPAGGSRSLPWGGAADT